MPVTCARARERRDSTLSRRKSMPSCVALLDQLDGAAEHVSPLVNFAVVAKSPLPRILTFAEERGWRRLWLFSAAGNTYNRDYLAETVDGAQRPMLNVFHRDGDTIRLFLGLGALLRTNRSRQIPPRGTLNRLEPVGLTPEGRRSTGTSTELLMLRRGRLVRIQPAVDRILVSCVVASCLATLRDDRQQQWRPRSAGEDRVRSGCNRPIVRVRHAADAVARLHVEADAVPLPEHHRVGQISTSTARLPRLQPLALEVRGRDARCRGFSSFLRCEARSQPLATGTLWLCWPCSNTSFHPAILRMVAKIPCPRSCSRPRDSTPAGDFHVLHQDTGLEGNAQLRQAPASTSRSTRPSNAGPGHPVAE